MHASQFTGRLLWGRVLLVHVVLGSTAFVRPILGGLRLAALIYSAIGVGFSIYFSYLQVTFIHAFCIYCLVSRLPRFCCLSRQFAHFWATRTLE